MRYTENLIEMHDTVCEQDKKLFRPCNSVNVLSVTIVSLGLDFSFPIEVCGTVIARDCLDLKCVYLFRRDANDCQLINSADESLILTGPKRGLALIDDMYFEIDLKIKRGEGVTELSKGLRTLMGVPHMFVQRAVEATFAVEVVQGEFFGEITAYTTSIQDRLVLHDTSKVAGVLMTHDDKRVAQLLRPVVAVCLQEKLTERTIEFTPGVNGGDQVEITCGSVGILVK
ncbi:hypothetical protein EJB05_07704, partial [Eragrostis curvula]